MTPEVGAARRGLGAFAASLALHGAAAAAVAAALAWRAAPVAPAAPEALQVVWIDTRPLAAPDPTAPAVPPEPARDALPPAAPVGDSAAEGLEPEDLLATMLPPDLPAPFPPATPETSESAAARSTALPMPHPPADYGEPMVADPTDPLDRSASVPTPPAAAASEPLAAGGAPAPPQRHAALAPPMPAPSEPPISEASTSGAPEQHAALAVPLPPPPAPLLASPPAPPRTAPPRDRPRRPRHSDDVAAAGRPTPAPSPGPASAAPPPQPPPLVLGPPRFRRPPSPPDYPPLARDRGEEGSVGLRVLVGADGETREVRVHRSSGNRLLDEAALAAARRWEVEPASVDGRRAEAWVEVPVRFRLDR